MKVRADQGDGDKDSKAPESKAQDVSPEKLRAAVEKLKADGVDEKVARKVRLCSRAQGQSCNCQSEWRTALNAHVQYFMSMQPHAGCSFGLCAERAVVGGLWHCD